MRCAALLGAMAVAAAVASAASIPAAQLLYHARVTHDLANMSVGGIAKDKRAIWMFARLAPGPHSGGDTTVGSYFDADTGKTVTRPGAYGAIIKEGSWKCVAWLKGRGEADQGRYSWNARQNAFARNFEPEQLFSPFIKGGLILCRFHPQAKGAAQFDPVYVIPDRFVPHVKGAFELLAKTPALFSQPPGPPQQRHLDALAAGDNPVLAILAFRTLLSSKGLGGAQLGAVMQRSAGLRRSAFTYTIVILALRERAAAKAALEELSRLTAATKKAGELAPIAVGLFTTGWLNRTDMACWPPWRKLVFEVHDRAKALGPEAQQHALLRPFLRLMKLRRPETRPDTGP